MKNEIEANFGGELEWERMDNKISCRIKAEMQGVSYFEREDWDRMTKYMIDSSSKMHDAFKGPIKKLNAYAKTKKY